MIAFERALAAALRSPDPPAALARAARRLPAAVRAMCLAVDADGLRLSALLVARLRFERLVQGSDRANAWFERDPEGFASAFRRYHEAVAPTSFFPGGEARLFERWLQRERDEA